MILHTGSSGLELIFLMEVHMVLWFGFVAKAQ